MPEQGRRHTYSHGRISLRGYVKDILRASVRDSLKASLRDSIRASLGTEEIFEEIMAEKFPNSRQNINGQM